MLYEVNYSCGHKGEVQIYGKSAERENKIKWYETKAVCPECYAAQKKAEREAELEAAKSAGYPELTGTEKQIAWAESIRHKFMKYADIFFDEFLTDVNNEKPEDTEKATEYAENVKSYILNNYTKASWWIDQRNTSDKLISIMEEYSATLTEED